MANNLAYIQIYFSYLEPVEMLGDAEAGRLLKALIRYGAHEEDQNVSGNEKYLYSMMKAQYDRDKKKYDEKCETNKKNINKRWDTNVYDGKNGIPKNTSEYETYQGEGEGEGEGEGYEGEDARARPRAPAKQKYGEYGWVKLSIAEYERLVSEFGEETAKYYISYIDESAQKTGNKNRWKDFNLVIRNAIRDKWGGTKALTQSAETQNEILRRLANEN